MHNVGGGLIRVQEGKDQGVKVVGTDRETSIVVLGGVEGIVWRRGRSAGWVWKQVLVEGV